MRNKWITHLQNLIHAGVSKTDPLLVKLVTITRNKSSAGVKHESSVKICPANFENCGEYVRWYIHDTETDCLIIETPVSKSAYLGHTKMTDNHETDHINSSQDETEYDDMYIISACKVIDNSPPKEKLTIRFCGNPAFSNVSTILAGTFDEAKAISSALYSNGMNTNIEKTH